MSYILLWLLVFRTGGLWVVLIVIVLVYHLCAYKHSLNMLIAAGLGKIRINNVTPEKLMLYCRRAYDGFQDDSSLTR
jgi:hypothetical protein